MSLYNMVHGFNPLTNVLLSFLETHPSAIPRFRDCFITEDGNIAIHTRTGGGNREYYEEHSPANDEGPWNSDLREIPGFIRDEDDDFDSTYATFYYKPNDDVAPLVKELQEIMGTETPGEKWQKLFADMEAGKDSPRVAHALKAAEPLIEAIKQAIEKDHNHG